MTRELEAAALGEGAGSIEVLGHDETRVLIAALLNADERGFISVGGVASLLGLSLEYIAAILMILAEHGLMQRVECNERSAYHTPGIVYCYLLTCRTVSIGTKS